MKDEFEFSDKLEDGEVWLLIAALLEAEPEHLYNNGLCVVLNFLAHHRVIDWNQHSRMSDQLYTRRRALAGYSLAQESRTAFFWPGGRVKPRIAACKKLAELVSAC